jgi:hypothetical protein
MTGKRRRAERKKKADGGTVERDLHETAYVRAEQRVLDAAEVQQGLDEEIATLKKKLAASGDEQLAFPLLARGMEVLTKMVVAKHRLSPKDAESAGESAWKAVRTLADQLYPEKPDAA